MGFGEQRLPLPVGSPHPIRRASRIFQGEPGPERTALALTGMLAAAAGALLTALPTAVPAGLDGRGYRVGEVWLDSRGSGVYLGAAGALVLVEDPGGALAGASTHLNGERMVGSCRMAIGGRSESCSFLLGGRSLSAEDRLRDGGWDRLYDDGRTIRISLDGGRPVPVPFAVGR
jgi:hypothetical protein